MMAEIDAFASFLDGIADLPARVCAECGPVRMITIDVGGRSRRVPVACDHEMRVLEQARRESERKTRTQALEGRFEGLLSTAWQNEREGLRDDLPQIEAPLRVARRMVDTLPERLQNGDGMMFQGNPGNGKSFLSQWVARQARAAGYYVIWVKIKQLCDFLRDWDNRADLMRALHAADLLVLDELVHSSETRWTADELMGLVDARHADFKSTIVTTNFTDQAIAGHYLDVLTRGKDACDRDKAGMMVQRFISRLQPPRYQRVAFMGPDYRLAMRTDWASA